MIRPEDAPDVDVREDDQRRICRFGNMNEQLKELRSDIKGVKDAIERMDDASTELMMNDGDDVKVMIGDAFISFPEDDATEYIEKQQEKLQGELEDLEARETHLLEEMGTLKETLYSRFGTSINLEDK